jgi:hypothetical protein
MITVNIDKAKTICHDKRRAARAAEFAPLDVKATIPAEAVQAEQQRQSIRQKYAQMQEAINVAVSVEELKSLLP